MASDRFDASSVPALSGRTALVTGANSGLGFEISRVLVKKGARLLFAVRDPERGAAALARLMAETPGAEVVPLALDLADLKSIRSMAETVASGQNRLDLLFNNAGVMAIPRRETAQGFEMQLGTNHFGHFALTGLLLPLLRRTPGSRVITTSSLLHRRGIMNFEDLDGRKRYTSYGAYGQSKLANLLFAYELDRRLKAAGVPVLSLACHPGYSATNLQTVGAKMEKNPIKEVVSGWMNAVLAQPASQGALTALYAAVRPEMKGGEFIGPDGFMAMRGFPVPEVSNDRSRSVEDAVRLWKISEERTGVSYSFA